MSLCGTDKRTNEQWKIELLSQWKLEAEFRNIAHPCLESIFFVIKDVSWEAKVKGDGFCGFPF